MKLTDDLLNTLSHVPTGNVADHNPHGGVMDEGIKAVNPELHLIGRAFTVKGHPGDNLPIYYAMSKAKAGDVLVIDCGGYSHGGHFGDMMANACKAKGIKGVIIDGSCRDAQDLRQLHYPVYARGFNPKMTVKETLGTLNETVVVGGVAVAPGDLIFADGDGVVVVPQAYEDQVISGALAKFHKESILVEKLKAGEDMLALYGLDELIAKKQAHV